MRGGEESPCGGAADGAKDALGGAEMCGGVDSASADETIGGPGTEMGDPETAGAAGALVRDTDAAGDGDKESCDTNWGAGLRSRAGDAISGH